MMVSHVASALADHWHSRAVSTEIVPVPPAGPIADGGALTATAHRSVVGPTTLVEEEDPLQAAINGSREYSNKRRQVRIRLLAGVSIIPIPQNELVRVAPGERPGAAARAAAHAKDFWIVPLSVGFPAHRVAAGAEADS